MSVEIFMDCRSQTQI